MATSMSLGNGFDWERKWLPSGEAPESWFAEECATTLAQLRDERVLILVGDPGSGKSFELAKERVELESLYGRSQVISIDSKSGISTDTMFLNLWFDTEKWKNWLRSQSILVVTLDGLDELVHRMPGIVELILSKLEESLGLHEGAKERLRLRITSRAISLPANFESRLSDIFFTSQSPNEPIENANTEKSTPAMVRHDEHGPIVFKLTVLTTAEIAEAATSECIDAKAFLAELERRGLLPLARRPKTLKFLVDTYSGTGGILDSFEEVYWKGLCHQLANLKTVSDPDANLRKLARIAFVMAFGKRSSLQEGTQVDPNDGNPLGLNVFLRSRTSTAPQIVELSIEELAEVPLLNLFSGDSERFYWSELPDMEFLAAIYAVDSGLPDQQLLELLRNPDDPKGRVVPELSNIAAHLASLSSGVFDAILETDPELLINADTALQDHQARRKLTNCILDAYESGKLIKTSWFSRNHFANLSFSELDQVLRPFITDTSLTRITRDLAIDIARDCHVTTLATDIGSLASSPDEDEVLRRSAAAALQALGDEESLNQMEMLLRVCPDDEESEEIRGWALQAVWPNRWPLTELLPYVTKPKSQVFGSYITFLWSHLVQKASDGDLPTLYRWYEQLEGWDYETPRNTAVGETLVRRAIDSIPDRSAVEFVASKIISPDEINLYRSGFAEDEIPLASAASSLEKRRSLVEYLIEVQSRKGDDCGGAARGLVDLYQLVPKDRLNEDINWIIGHIVDSSLSSEESKAWIELLGRFRDVYDHDSMQKVYEVYLEYPSEAGLSELFRAVDISGEEADRLKKSWEIFGQGRRFVARQQEKAHWFAEELKQILGDDENEEDQKWYRIDHLLRLTIDHRLWPGTYSSTVQELENWPLVKESDFGQFASAASKYLGSYDPICSHLAREEYYFADQAAYRALTFLFDHSRELLSSLGSEDWKRLGPVLFSMPPRTSGDPPVHLDELLRLALGHDFDWRPWLESLLQSNVSSGYHFLPLMEAISKIVDESDRREFADRVLHGEYSFTARHLLTTVIGKQDPQWVTTNLIQMLGSDHNEPANRILILTTALDFFSSEQWPELIGEISKDEDTFKKVFMEFSYRPRPDSDFSNKLDEQQLADLYLGLAEVFPPNEDQNPIGMHTVTPRENVGRWREELLDILANRGTWLASSEIRRIATRLPMVEWLQTRAAQAENFARQRTWVPHSVRDLLAVLPASEARLVRSNKQLQAVIVESLERLNQRLQGPSPSAVELWTSDRGKIDGEPKNEDTLSDYIKRHLDQDLGQIPVFSNREVHNRPTQRNDVLVEYGLEEPPIQLRVVCEVKGCWNPEIGTNMKSQLVDQYMQSYQTAYGVFIVGFFDTDNWPRKGGVPPKDTRHRARVHTIDQVKGMLNQQADELRASGKYVIPVVLDCRLPWDVARRS